MKSEGEYGSTEPYIGEGKVHELVEDGPATCHLCGEDTIVKTEDHQDRCTLCAYNTCAKCGEESAGDFCASCGYYEK